ncbi:MAG: hypothetical protein L0H53_14695 [Candidatus Nitrosocosmicus sp.]|nr:hypothetical protein [Candidatus Nitrosocosmicus sp.]MDN5868612.1 hypothetical protein [Candidatus Nitrosocosmicus sp.]
MTKNKINYKMSVLAISAVLILSSLLVFPMQQQNTFGQNISTPIECISIDANKTSVAGPSPSKEVISPLGKDESRGFSNITDIEKSTGSNRVIFLNNTDIGNPGLTLAEGLEKSQLGNKILGQQDTIMEGSILKNITEVCWQN